jgi:hypothetical protein
MSRGEGHRRETASMTAVLTLSSDVVFVIVVVECMIRRLPTWGRRHLIDDDAIGQNFEIIIDGIDVMTTFVVGRIDAYPLETAVVQHAAMFMVVCLCHSRPQGVWVLKISLVSDDIFLWTDTIFFPPSKHFLIPHHSKLLSSSRGSVTKPVLMSTSIPL